MVEYPDISLFVSVYLPNQFVHRDENISPNHPFSQINCPEIKGTVIRMRNVRIYKKYLREMGLYSLSGCDNMFIVESAKIRDKAYHQRYMNSCSTG